MNISELFFNYGYYKYFNEKKDSWEKFLSFCRATDWIWIILSLLKIWRYGNDINVKHTYMYDKDRL